jgi:hypothetical protein
VSQAAPVPAKFVAAQQSAEEGAPTGNWGTLRGRFVHGEATPPGREKIVATKDAFCMEQMILDDLLVVGAKGELANVFVFIYVPRGRKLDVHESYQETADAEVVLDNNGCSFEPHCLALQVSQTLSIKNSDPVGHNTNIPNHFNQIVPQDDPLEYQFKAAAAYPLPVQCNIHPWMSAHLLVRDDPYAAISAEDGSFEIKNIPAGTHEFVFWHERPGLLGNVNAGKVKTDRRGRMKIEIPAGKIVDLGEIKIPAKSLEAKF